MEQNARALVLSCGHDEKGSRVRLMGSYSQAAENKALVIFLHGWEGSQDSTYIVSTARLLYDQGCSVFRLNFRDHGNTHHLNEDIFLATRFDEVFEGVRHAAQLADGAPVYLTGFSLGGNFALRVARALKHRSIDNLVHIFAISPVIDPWAAAPLVDTSGWLIQRYFKKKLIATMTKKQQLYPQLHDFSYALSCDTIMEMSQDILPKYSGYPDLQSYFTAYGIRSDDLIDCETPISLIMANDDQIVPAAHIDDLNLPETCRDIRLAYGGHNGFFQSLTGPTWYDEYITKIILG